MKKLIYLSVCLFFLSLSACSSGEDFGIGQKVKVEWKGTWYEAEIVDAKDGKFKIHYVGYNSNWDEWVDEERVKSAD